MEQMTFADLTQKLTTLYTEGKYAEALQWVEQNMNDFPEQAARTTFWRMCLLSLSNRMEETISVFRQGLDAGLWWQGELFADPDLNAVRDLPAFQHLMGVSQEKYGEAQKQVERDFALLLPEPPLSGQYPLLVTLHGRNGNKEVDLGRWEMARQRGWLVLSCQSTQPVFQGAYHWDNAAHGLKDLLFYYEQVSQTYLIDLERVTIAGFSQGSGMAIYAAVKGSLPVRGFIGIGTWWADAGELVVENKDVRGYFITGEKDHTLDRTREIQDVLRRNHIQFSEELHADIGHEFPANFGASFDKAIEFIFKEHE